MKLTVLGAFGPYPSPGGACSGYLLQDGKHNILLDCGNGVLSRLQKHIKPWELDAVFLSHLHYDHISDIFIMRYALDIAGSKGIISDSIKVYSPEEPSDELSRLPYKEVYEVIPLTPDQDIEEGSFRISFLPVAHPIPCFAMKIESGNKTIVYSGDTEYFSGLITFAAGCDLFLCEANFQNEDMENFPGNHLSAVQAGKIAAHAGVKKMLLTHLPPGRDISVSLEEAKKVFSHTETATEEKQYVV